MIIDIINKKIIELYKANETEERTLLQTLKSEVLTRAKNMGKELDDNEVIQVFKAEKKQIEQSLDQFKSVGRQDLIDKANKELAIIESYLPEELSLEKIEEMVSSLKEDGDDFAKLMKKAMEKLKGQADGGKIAVIVKKITG